ncbi:putative two-component response regulator [Planktothrix serta PCC 8927]|uniref:Two-component response regulator n=1 Tax=Planktothrix serta PCC 8927 TaxID=671068 RepID=A0A7Z9BX29_9CYAN|nr:putative two-component response regulator [Planktothrix serta PCC 8927]
MCSRSNFNYWQSKSILVVDDSLDILFLVEAVLQGAGYSVRCAENGYIALDQVKESPPDVMVVDLMMPGLSGYDVIHRIRQNSDLPFIPILMMTACSFFEVRQESKGEANGVIYKPIDIDELLNQVSFMLQLQQKKTEHQLSSTFREKSA